MVVAVDAHQSSEVQVTEVQEIVPPVAPEAPPVRRRLTQTVTLGQSGGGEPVYAPSAPPPSQGTGNSQNVVVNNNVTVVNSPPVVYGGYGGYGGYGYGGYGGRGVSGSRESFGGSRPGWGTTGWEGAQRTARPGATPGVGGNFAPAPSFGPAQMK